MRHEIVAGEKEKDPPLTKLLVWQKSQNFTYFVWISFKHEDFVEVCENLICLFTKSSTAGGALKCAVGCRSEIELNIWQITFIKSAGELEKGKTIQELLTFEDQSSNWVHTILLSINTNIAAA